MCNLTKTEIDIVVLDETKPSVEKFSFKPDDKFKWNKDDKFKPNVEDERLNGKMTVLNYKNRHFNLIIDKNHALFQVGSLKFQQEKSKNNKKLVETLFKKNTLVKELSASHLSEKLNDSSVDEHIHCHREDDTCLDKKHESELVVIKKELEKYKIALKEEVAKRSKVEDMFKAMQTVQKIHLEKQNLSEILTSEYTNKDNNSNLQIMKSCELCDFSCKFTNELENHFKLSHQSRTCDLCNKQYSTLIQIKRHN